MFVLIQDEVELSVPSYSGSVAPCTDQPGMVVIIFTLLKWLKYSSRQYFLLTGILEQAVIEPPTF